MIKRKVHYVYKTVNAITGDEYIGVHSTFDLNDGYIGSESRLKGAIKEYGKQSFKKTIIQMFNARQDAFIKEKQLVCKEYLSNANTYNLISGGNGNINDVKLFDPKNYITPHYNCDIHPALEFIVDAKSTDEFKQEIKVSMEINNRDLAIVRKQFSQLIFSQINEICRTLTAYWNDQRFHNYCRNMLYLLFQLGFGKIIKARYMN